MSRIIRIPDAPVPASSTFSFGEPELLLPSRSTPQLLARCILDPVDGCEVLVALDLADLLVDGMLFAGDCFVETLFGGREGREAPVRRASGGVGGCEGGGE